MKIKSYKLREIFGGEEMNRKSIRNKIIMGISLCLLISISIILTGCGQDKSKSDWEYIKDKGTLVVGLDDTFAPMGFRDENDEIVGFDIDLAKAVGDELGIKVEFKPIDWDAKDGELKSKKIDCVWNGMSWTKDRDKSMSLSYKYMNNKIIVMSADNNINIKDSSELSNYKISTQADSSALDGLKADKNYDKFKDNIKEYKDYAAAYLDMKAGRVDVMVIDKVMGEYTYPELKISDYIFMDDFYAVGFRKGDKELTAKVNEALKMIMDNGKGKEISQKWFKNDDSFIVKE